MSNFRGLWNGTSQFAKQILYMYLITYYIDKKI